jgi:hypothetical protein
MLKRPLDPQGLEEVLKYAISWNGHDFAPGSDSTDSTETRLVYSRVLLESFLLVFQIFADSTRTREGLD